MKRRLPSALIAIVTAMSATVAEEPGSLLHVVEVFTLPSGVAMALLDQDLPGAELRQKLITLTKGKPTTLEKLLVMRGHLGEKIALRQTDEYLYPTEFDPPQVPPQIAIIDPGEKVATSAPDEVAKRIRSPFNGGLGTMTTTTPTAFEMRQLGDQFEVDTAFDHDGRTLRCDYTLQSTKLLRVEMTRDIPRPVFASRKLAGKIRFALGIPAFLGTYDPSDQITKGLNPSSASTSLAFLTVRGEIPPSKPIKRSDTFQGGGGDHAPPPGDLRVTFEAIALDRSAAHALIIEGLSDAALHARLHTLIKDHHATLETVIAARGRSGMRLQTGNREEFIYPTEFDPPQMPQNLVIADHQLIGDLRQGRQSGFGAQPPMEGVNPNGGFGLITSLSCTAFESVVLGELIELEPVIGGGRAEVMHSTQFRRLAGKVRYNGIDHPVFESRSLNARSGAELGKPALLGTFSKATSTGFTNTQPDDRVWFGFLRVSKL